MSSEHEQNNLVAFRKVVDGEFDALPDGGWSELNNDYRYLDPKSGVAGLGILMCDIHDYAFRRLKDPDLSPDQVVEINDNFNFANNHLIVFNTIYLGIQYGFPETESDSCYTKRVTYAMHAAIDEVEDLYREESIDESVKIQLVNFSRELAALYIVEEGRHFVNIV